MANVDWDHKTVLNKSKPKGSAGGPVGKQSGEKRDAVGNKAPGVDRQRLAKLDNENEVAKPKDLGRRVGDVISKKRNELSMSQKDLALKASITPNILSTYENGTAIPDQAVLGKIERALNVKLRGANIGEPKIKKKTDGK